MSITRMALTFWMAGAFAQARETQQKVTVDLRFGTNDRMIIKPLAKYLAGKMFADVGINLVWKGGERAGGPSEPHIIIEVVSSAPRDFKPQALAYAQPYEGSHITVFLDRIERQDYPAVVFAHVLVHEITHMLQGVGRHSETGIMKAHWTDHDYCEMRRRPVPFAPEDVDLIYYGLLRRRGLTSMPTAAP